RPEAIHRHRRREQFPIALELPQIPGGVDLRAAIRLEEFARHDHYIGWRSLHFKLALDHRGLRVIEPIDAQRRPALRELRKREQCQEPLEMAQGVGIRESAQLAGEVQAIAHISESLAASLNCTLEEEKA